MGKEIRFYEDELSTEIRRDGVRFVIVAFRCEDGAWLLSIRNDVGIVTNWLDTFPTAQTAIDVGLDAIEAEGVGVFTDVEGFEYFDEGNV